MRPIDIVDVKAGINAGRLHVAVKGKYLLLGDYQTGESIRLSDIEVKPVEHARWEKVSEWMPIYLCSECKERNLFKNGDNVLSNYCPSCGAKMDGDPDG